MVKMISPIHDGPRSWNIQVIQFKCDDPSRAPLGCLQYFLGNKKKMRSDDIALYSVSVLASLWAVGLYSLPLCIYVSPISMVLPFVFLIFSLSLSLSFYL